MKSRYVPLWTRILLLAMLNLALIAGVFVVFLQSQLQPDLESFLMAGARDRITVLSTRIASDLQTAPSDDWNKLLQQYSDENGIRVLLYRNTREQLAGPTTTLPAQVDARMPPRPGPRNGRGGTPQGGFDRAQRDESGERGNLDRRRGDGPQRGDFGERGNFDRGRGDGPQRGQGTGEDYGSRPFLVVTDTTPKYWAGVRMPAVDRENGEKLFSVLVLTSNSFFLNSFFFEARSWLGLGIAAFLISVACWTPLVRNITHSVTDMMRATGRIADGRFNVEMSTGRHDELGRLGTSIKQMAGSLESHIEGRTRFLGSVAHELRSPIARMRLATEILERDGRSENRKHIEYLKEDIETMTRLTDELLQVARAESAPGPVRVQAVNVSEIIETAVRKESTDGTEIHCNPDPSISVQANPEYLGRAIGNVLRNSIRYAGKNGPITIRAERHRDEVAITVSDAGPGVPETDLDKIFMPFYRIDDARDRRTGGTGLGLAIVRSCIEACGGKVTASNRQPSGLEIVVTLPSA